MKCELQQRMQLLLTDAISLLCKNAFKYDSELKVQGLIGVTVDGNEAYIIQVNEIFDPVSSDADDQTVQQEAKNLMNIDEQSNPNSRSKNLKTESDLSEREHNFTNKLPCRTNQSIDFHQFHDDKQYNVAPYGEDTKIQGTATKNRRPKVASTKTFSHTISSQQKQGYLLSQTNITVKSENFEMPDKKFEGKYDDWDGSAEMVNYEDPGFAGNDFVIDLDAEDGAFEDEEFQEFSEQLEFPSDIYQSNQHYSRPQKNQRNFFKAKAKLNAKSATKFKNSDKELVLTQSLHICGYDGCGRQFHHRRNLLRHQTEKHGRSYKKRSSDGRGWNPWTSEEIQNEEWANDT